MSSSGKKFAEPCDKRFLRLIVGNVGLHTHTRTLSHTHTGCGWKKISSCEALRVSCVPLTAERIYHNSVGAHQLREPWRAPRSGSPSCEVEGHHRPVGLVPAPFSPFSLRGSQLLEMAPKQCPPCPAYSGRRMMPCTVHCLWWRWR